MCCGASLSVAIELHAFITFLLVCSFSQGESCQQQPCSIQASLNRRICIHSLNSSQQLYPFSYQHDAIAQWVVSRVSSFLIWLTLSSEGCSRRKLKCDETKPTCTRCSSSSTECAYIKDDFRHDQNPSMKQNKKQKLYAGRNTFEDDLPWIDIPEKRKP